MPAMLSDRLNVTLESRAGLVPVLVPVPVPVAMLNHGQRAKVDAYNL
jgi:hypothetical protein